MNTLLKEVSQIIADLRSDKNCTRNKAAELLDYKLTNSKTDLIAVLQGRRNNDELTWSTIFQCAVDAMFTHAAKLDEIHEKAFQTQSNKNHIYSNIVRKLIDYNLDVEQHFLSKSAIIKAFVEGMSNRSVVKYFGLFLLVLLDRGIYKSMTYVRELQVNEYSRILSHLFEVNVGKNDLLRFGILKTITHTVEVAIERVQIGVDIIDYLPELLHYCQRANNDQSKADVVRLCYLFLTELSIDYHNRICNDVQQLIPLICDFYDEKHMKSETKKMVFECITMSLYAIYPHIAQGDFNTINLTVHDNWSRSIRKMRTIINMEIRSITPLHSRPARFANDKNFPYFTRMSALVCYVLYWHLGEEENDGTEVESAPNKKSRTTDKLETIIDYVQLKDSTYNEIWFAILTELIYTCRKVLNVANYQQTLEFLYSMLRVYKNVNNMQNVRCALEALLSQESELCKTQDISADFFSDHWSKVVDYIINETASDTEVIAEKQFLLQALIREGKLKDDHTITLLQYIMAHSVLKRNECIRTIRDLFVYGNIDNATPDVGRIISWAYGSVDSSDMSKVIYNITDIDAALVSDTFAISVINFLTVQPIDTGVVNTSTPYAHRLKLLMYKYNREYMCLTEHDEIMVQRRNKLSAMPKAKNCLFQNNYELLMRLLNYEISKEVHPRAIIKDMTMLHHLSSMMATFLKHEIFNDDNYLHCPLMKRIGFFLSHLEFQLKSNEPREFLFADLHELLVQLETIFRVFINNKILLQYLETQPLEELINFVKKVLTFSATQHTQVEFSDWINVSYVSLRILCNLCAGSTHYIDAFAQISKHNTSNLDTKDVVRLVAMFCTFENIQPDIAKWLVEKLKIVFTRYHRHIELIDELVPQLPAIFAYVYVYEDQLQNMLIALMSLLKIAFKKSYPVRLTTKILKCIAQIAESCRDIFTDTSFANICISLAKFLTFASLEIQYAAISALTTLFNVTCVSTNTVKSCEKHVYFCVQLYTNIDWKQLETITADHKQNSISASVQFLVSLFIFSSIHQNIALRELSCLCGLRQLDEVNFSAFKQKALYFNCTLRELAKPYMQNIVQHWTSQENPISKFPYFLFCSSRLDFFKDNVTEIGACLLLYGNVDELKYFQMLIGEPNILEQSVPLVQPYFVTADLNCPEGMFSDYKKQMKQLKTNVKYFGLEQNCKFTGTLKPATIFSLLKLLRDASTQHKFFGFDIYPSPSQWFNLNEGSLSKCLHYYVCFGSDCANPADYRLKIATELVCMQSLRLMEVFGLLKVTCYDCAFVVDKLRYFHIFCTLGEMIIDAALLQNIDKTNIAKYNCYKYFVRDVIFFALNFLQTKSDSCYAQRAALSFLRLICLRPEACSNEVFNNIYDTYLNEIFKPLVLCAQHTPLSDIRESAIELISDIIAQRNTIDLLDEFPEIDMFNDLRAKQSAMQTSEVDSQTTITTFLSMQNRGIGGLRALRTCIAKHRPHIQADDALHVALIKRLIKIVRDSNQTSGNLDAAKCLGELGPLQMRNARYYFETDCTFAETDSAAENEPLQSFISDMYQTLEQLLLKFDAATHMLLISVAECIVNSNVGTQLLVTYPNMQVFSLRSTVKNFLNSYASIASIDWLAALQATQTKSYDQWICDFMKLIFEYCGWKDFSLLAAKQAKFAEACLQPFVKLLLASNKDKHLKSLCKLLEYFFAEFVRLKDKTPVGSRPGVKTIYVENRAINKFLNICEWIRIVNMWELPLTLHHVIRASNHCQAYFSSIMYLELWAGKEQQDEKLDPSTSRFASGHALMDKDFQSCLKTAYEAIGCTDAMFGFVDPLQSRLDYLNLDNDWAEILLQSNKLDMQANQMWTDILKRNGMLSLANQQQQEKWSAVDYEVFWRLGDWNEVVRGSSKMNTLNDMEHEFNKHHYVALKSISNNEENNCRSAIGYAHESIIAILREISVECLQSVYKYMTWLNMLQQTEDFAKLQFRTTPDINEVFTKWKMELELSFGNFRCKQDILTHQIALFKMGGTRAKRKISYFYKDNPIESCLLQSIRECKHAGELNLAKRNIVELLELPDITVQAKVAGLLEDAELSSRTGQTHMANAILQHVLNNSEYIYCLQRVTALRMRGEHLMKTNASTFESVLHRNFKGSLRLLQSYIESSNTFNHNVPKIFHGDSLETFQLDNRKAAYEVMAKYADRQYKQLDDYLNSEEYQMRLNIIKKNRLAAESVSQIKDRDTCISANTMKRFANIDEKELQSLSESRTEYLCTAVNNYVKFCKLDDSFSSEKIYRIIALWFANKQNSALQKLIEKHIPTLPSYKFICALNQLTAHLNSNHKEFVAVLSQLLVRCAQDHPHHTFYQLYPLVYANADSGTSNNANHQRIRIAREILNKASNSNNAACRRQLEALFPALIEYANFSTQGSSLRKVPLSEKLKQLKSLDAVQCPTIELAVQPDAKYDNITSIVSWTHESGHVGGINQPKKLMCLCSDGKTRPQLLKGKDDLRQDAVMQQVFKFINNLLHVEPETSQRKLQLRTYKITPLSMRSGILEWCENTVPVGVYLTGDGKGGAHKKYRPDDFTSHKCRQLIFEHLKSPAAKRYELYKHICKNIKPVFQYFLLEKFAVPGVWFERRLAYTNSLATTSIVGFILGIGDRHTQNILIDEKTAELVHIDFGIAFELGKVMPTPETVPFRLTRDFVAPMGVCGTNGVFKKSCESTLRILRRYQTEITTILEVLLYDPLYSWNIVPQRESSADSQVADVDQKNLTAQRALLVVQNKLEGREAGILGFSDVEVQVERLINEGTSVRNLCMLYPGWDSHL